MTPERFDHEGYLSPFTWRYGSPEMRAIWGEVHKRRTWRRIWVAMARAQATCGLVSDAQADDLAAHARDIDIARAHALERDLQHDVMAEVKTFAEQCPVGGGIIHLGATSMDVIDNADALRLREALDLLLARLTRVLTVLAQRVLATSDIPTMGFTHLQPAEPTTIGYRLAQYTQDLLADLAALRRVRATLRGKGFKGAVGTSASYVALFGSIDGAHAFETAILESLDLPAYAVTTQTAPRKQDHAVVSALADVAQSLYRFAYDVRILQSPPFGEWAEPFGSKQVGSSAMPFKKNPIHTENMTSLARLVANLPRVTWDNAAHAHLERTLDDSANRRVVLPQACLATDELLRRAERVISGLQIDTDAADRTLAAYGTFAATERVMMEAVTRGGDRQVLHAVLREHTLAAWPAVQSGGTNPLPDALAADPRITRWVPADALPALLDARGHVGDAAERARELALQAVATTAPFEHFEPAALGAPIRGKVRDAWPLADGQRLLVTTDRVSAFDRVLGTIPFKGQVLNQLAAWWFSQTADIIPNHVVSVPDPNALIARDGQPLPVEVVVRGYITGVTSTSLWTLYEQGVDRPYGLSLPAGLRKNDRLPEAVITPTTKATGGAHDERLSSDEVVSRGLVGPALWAQIQQTALALFARGQAIAAERGLILVDTKYEFGLIDGVLTLIDEIHTPDSSRYWLADSYAQAMSEGTAPKHFDKERLRQWLAAHGYRGEGAFFGIPADVQAALASHYVAVYERLTGERFNFAPLPTAQRLEAALTTAIPGL